MMSRRSVSGLVAGWLVLQPCAWAADVSVSPMPGFRIHTSVESLLERRWKHVVRQGIDISCGSGALATLLRYHFGNKVSEQALIKTILKEIKPEEIRSRGGFSLLDLKRAAMRFGYQVRGYRLSLEQLEQLGPALVAITIRGYKHFVVFRGVFGDRVLLADPAFGNILLESGEFTRIWSGVALALAKEGPRRRPSQLHVTPEDLAFPEAHEALRSFTNQTNFHTTIGPDEF